MRKTACLLCLMLLTAQAMAQEGTDNPFNNDGGFAGTSGTAPRAPDKPEVLRIRITKRDCRRLAIETRSADVAYQPGVDVRGNAVESADLHSGFQYTLPDVIEFPITINPVTFQADRREAAARQALADRLAENPVELEALQDAAFNETLDGLLADAEEVETELALIQADFDAREAAIIAATGGDTPTNQELVQRNDAIALLEQEVFGSDTFQTLSAQQSALAAQISQQTIGLEQIQTELETEQAEVTAARDVFVNDFETQKAAIVAATGGDLQTDPAVLDDRATQIAELEETIFGSAEFQAADAAFQANAAALTANEAALDINQAAREALQDEAASFGAAEAQIAAEAVSGGVFASNESTITVAQVRFDILSGKVTINGEPLVDSARQDVLDRCAAAGFLP
ncbi:MAG: hypothetical protein RIM72_05020 [Alphaproteobacteria bacterium]